MKERFKCAYALWSYTNQNLHNHSCSWHNISCFLMNISTSYREWQIICILYFCSKNLSRLLLKLNLRGGELRLKGWLHSRVCPSIQWSNLFIFKRLKINLESYIILWTTNFFLTWDRIRKEILYLIPCLDGDRIESIISSIILSYIQPNIGYDKCWIYYSWDMLISY